MSEAVTHAEHHTSTGVDNRMLMMWIFLASECLFFGSLISTYLIYQGESLVGPLPGELLNIPNSDIVSQNLVNSTPSINDNE